MKEIVWRKSVKSTENALTIAPVGNTLRILAEGAGNVKKGVSAAGMSGHLSTG